MGFKKPENLLIYFVLPVIASSFVIFFLLVLLTSLPLTIPVSILLLGLSLLVLIPLMIRERKKMDIHNNLHFFITYAGTISTMDISRSLLFKKIATNNVFGEISNISEKILYLSKEWNLGFAKTCRKVGAFLPSKIFSEFLDRFAIMMDFGESLHTFLYDEQDAVMDDYALEYKKSLEVVRTLQDIFTSLIITLSFGMAIALMLPLILGVAIDYVIQWAFLALAIVDIFMVVLAKAFVPTDPLFHNLPILDVKYEKLRNYFLLALSATMLIFSLLYSYTSLSVLISFAFAAIPLGILGFYSNSIESVIASRDQIFPVFIRSLGSAIEMRSGAVLSSLTSLKLHEFGELQLMVKGLFARLRIGADKYLAWRYFAGESGSNLIAHYSRIFSESVYLGGNAEKVGEMVSKNFLRLLSLRKLKLQLSSGLRGSLYGSLLGFTGTAFITAQIMEMLSDLFSQPFDLTEQGGLTLTDILGSSGPVSALGVDMQLITFYIGMMVLIHSIISSIVIKVVDGGSLYSSLLDFSLMIALGAVLSHFAPMVIASTLPDLAAGGAI